MHMNKDNLVEFKTQAQSEASNPLEDILRQGARQLLEQAIQNEVGEYISEHQDLRDCQGRREVVRNGTLPERQIQSGIGPITIKQPRVHDRRAEHQFSSNILPPYMRRTPSIDALIPALYLRGVSTGDFCEALSAILGEHAAGLSATNIVRLKEGWQKDYQQWQKRQLGGKRYVYWWADGIYFKVRLNPDRPCVLVIMGSLADGAKELIAVVEGQRESKLSWQEILRDLKDRGLTQGPKLAVGDGAMGFWSAMEEEFPAAIQQRCWVHKTANVLNKLPKSVQPSAKARIHEMYLAPTQKEAFKAYESFLDLYQTKYSKACDCLKKDKDVLFQFYQFLAEHWSHIRTTNPIESLFATVRHRTRQTKGCGSTQATLAMVFQLVRVAEKKWSDSMAVGRSRRFWWVSNLLTA